MSGNAVAAFLRPTGRNAVPASLAEKSLTQLEQLKPKLPAEWHPRVDQARKAFNAAKTGLGLKLDSLLPSGAK